MVSVHFPALQDLKPGAFKLYVYLLHRAEQTGSDEITMPLVTLGWESGLQPDPGWRLGKLHGFDSQVRRALGELIERGYVEKIAGRGRRPNTYRLTRR